MDIEQPIVKVSHPIDGVLVNPAKDNLHKCTTVTPRTLVQHCGDQLE